MTCPHCDDEGEMRAYIELIRLPDDYEVEAEGEETTRPQWMANALLVGKPLPEATIFADDPREALTEAGWVLGAVAMEEDWNREGEAA